MKTVSKVKKAHLKAHLGKLFFLLAALFMFLMLKAGKGQEVKFSCAAPPVIGVGEQFRVAFSVNVAGTDFRGPNFKGFSVLSGPSQSSSSSIQIINGAMSQTISYTYTYILRADKEGEFEIGPATISVNGTPIKSQPSKLKVVKSNATRQQPAGGTRNQQQQGTQGTGTGTEIAATDLFVKTTLSKSDVFQGEQILLTQKIYSKVNLVGFDDVKYPSYSGFWSTEVKMPDQISLKKETYNGQVYNVAELRKTILFPQKSGTLTIEPIDVTCVVQMRSQARRRTGDPLFDNFFNDPFFNTSVQNVKKVVRSSPITVRVKPLPEAGKPEDFNGSVGSFSLKAAVDKRELKANEAINYKVTINGSGNLELIDKLQLQFPGDFEVYDPKISGSVTATSSGVSGSRVFEYLIIPRNPGKFTIEPVLFSFFDLGKKAYVSLQSESFELVVSKGDGSAVNYSGVSKEDIKYLGSDIRYLKTGTPAFVMPGSYLFNSWFYWLLLALLALLFTLVLIIWRRRVKLLSDKSLLKNRQATRVAVRRLKKAGDHLRKKEENDFYVEVSQALWGYLADKLYIPPAGLSMEKARESLVNHNLPAALIDQYLQTIETCEYARFAPGVKEEKMDKLYQQALEVITKTEKGIKLSV